MHLMKCLFLFVLISACSSADAPLSDAQLRQKAESLVKSSVILDGHIDVPYRLVEEMEDISGPTEKGEFDYPRAKQGGLDVPFMSIFVPAEKQKTPGASKRTAEGLIAMMDSIIAAHPDKFAAAGDPQTVRKNKENGLVSFAYGMENGSPIENDLANVAYFHKKGVRYITLTHSKMNQICDSSYDPNKGWNGLSPFGREVVAEMNRVGIMVDISHVSDSTFYQVLRQSRVPVICSHSSLRHFTPGWERNVDDAMMKALAQNGGVIQINFGSAFLTREANGYNARRRSFLTDFMEENGIENRDDERVKEERQKFEDASGYPFASVEDVVDHIDRAVQIAGIDHVGLGSDFDGVGETLPVGLKSVADYPNLVFHLLKRGYADTDIKKILGENVLRVWQAVTDYATIHN